MSRYSFNKQKIRQIKSDSIRSIIYEIWGTAKAGGIRQIQSMLRSKGSNIRVDGWLGNKSINAINRNREILFNDLVEILKGIYKREDSKSNTTLTRKMVEQTAYDLGISGGAVYAIAKVESRGSFVWNNGKIPILYERHVCYRELKNKHGSQYAKKMYRKYPALCNPKWGGYGKSSIQYGKLHKATRLFGKELAYLSSSHGAFQIMGFNYETCGYNSVIDMVEDMRGNPVVGQLRAFANFVRNYQNGRLLNALKRKDWHEVARRYNGSQYARNRYHIKMARASVLYDEGIVLA